MTIPSKTKVKAISHLFIAVYPPKLILDQLDTEIKNFKDELASKIDAKKMHLTLSFIGEYEGDGQLLESLATPLWQHYLPTIALTHIGRGLNQTQLWAYAHRTPVLNNVHLQIQDRLKEIGISSADKWRDYTPHINLGQLKDDSTRLGMHDKALTATFTPQFAHLLRSIPNKNGTNFVSEGMIKFSP